MSLAAVADKGGWLDRLLDAGAGSAPAFHELRRRAAAHGRAQNLPTTRDEEWRFTDPAPLLRQEFAAAAVPTLAPDAVQAWLLPETQDSRLVFVNGVFAPQLSSRRLPEGVRLLTLAEAQADAELAGFMGSELGRHAETESHVFAALNTAVFSDGAVLLIARNRTVESPLHLLFITVPQATPHIAHPRCLIVAERGSQTTVIEDYVTVGEGSYCNNSVGEVVLGENAQIIHARLQREATSAFHIAQTAATLARDAQYHAINLTLGARLSRHDVRVRLAEEGAQCSLSGLNLLSGRQLGDTHSLIDHAVPHCTSRQLHKCIVDGNAHAVFNGKVRVRHGAQQTDSEQSSRNLLLSEKARVDTKPELQIDADDVKCAHGAAVGQLDMDEVFYLQSRGLSQSAARGLLTYAFAAEIIDRLPVASLREKLCAGLVERMHVEVLP